LLCFAWTCWTCSTPSTASRSLAWESSVFFWVRQLDGDKSWRRRRARRATVVVVVLHEIRQSSVSTAHTCFLRSKQYAIFFRGQPQIMSAVSFFSPGRVRECVYTFSKDLVSLSLGRIKLLGWLIWDA
jgi:hypothetical protein